MDKFIEYLNNRTDAYRICKFVSVTYNQDAKTLEMVLVYPETFVFTQQIKDDLEKYVQDYIGISNVAIRLSIKKSYLDVDVIKRFLTKYLKEQFTALFSTLSSDWCKIDIEDKNVNITLFTTKVYKEYLAARNFENNLKNSLEKIFFGDFSIKVEEDSTVDLKDSLKMQEEMVENALDSLYKKKMYYKIHNVESFIGPKIEVSPIAIKDLDKSVEKNVICGKIIFLSKRNYKTNKKDENGNIIEKTLYSFTLKDTTDSIHCVVFLIKATQEKLETLQDNMIVAVSGDVDDYNDRLSFKVKDISTCEIEIDDEEEPAPTRKLNDRYIYIKPQPYENKGQVDLFSFDKVDKVNDFLKDKDFVVYDFETTGLDTQNDIPIEIGAVKIHNGKIVETFETLINPMREISQEITKITGITNDMLKDQLGLDKVLPDFMKFIGDSGIVGYNNISFDNKILANICKKYGFKMSTVTYDAYVLARQYVRGVKNHKLGTIAQHLGVALDNAHRAIYDTIATAEVFIKLSDYIH